MISLHNINSIAKYETKTLLRSWFFRIFAILAIVFLFFFNFGILTQSNGGSGEWQIKALPSLIPYVNIFLLNIAQAIIAIFLASDFLKRDKKLDTTEVIYMRSMTNGEYVIGKTIGNLIVFLVLNIIILLDALIFNLAVGDLSVSWVSYFNYFILMSVPTLVFIMGLSFLLMSVLRNQAITFIILLGYVALTLFYLQNKFYFVFDYMAFRIPLAYSDFVGFGNKTTILIHRGIYLSLGLSFIFLTISFLKRLPQAKHFRQFSVFLSALFFALGIYFGYLHVSNVITEKHMRAEMLTINNSYSEDKAPVVSSYQIDVKHLGERIQVRSLLKVTNSNTTKNQKLFFSLNPGLEIQEIQRDGKVAEFTRKQHLVELKNSLLPSDSTTIEFKYAGSINEAACYLDVDDDKIMEPFTQMMYQIDKRHSFITNDFVLLTRENMWYPIPGTSYGDTNMHWFDRQFSKYDLSIETKPGLVAISQGSETLDENISRFSNKTALSQISLVIGDYQKTTKEVDGLNFNLYVKDGHDYFSKFFEEINDTIPSLIAESLKDFERTIDMYYPFETFSLVEVPIQYYSYDHVYSGELEGIQPEMILFPEKGVTIREADFAGRLARMTKYSHGDEANLTPKEQKIRVFQSFVSNFTQQTGRPNFSRSGGSFQVTESTNAYYAFPMFYNQAYFINSEKWPVTNRIFESYLKQASANAGSGFIRSMQGTSEDEQANIALMDFTFAELLKDPEKLDIIDNVIKLKGEALFSIIKRKAGDEAFDNFIFDFMSSHKFKSASIQEFNDSIKNRFDVDLLPQMEDWFNSKGLPAYLVGAVSAVEVLDMDQLKTMVKFKVTNASSIEGIISVQFMMGGGGGRGSFGGGSMTTVDKLVHLDGNQTKQVSFLLDSRPRRVTVNTLTSKNVPNELNFPLDKIEEDKKAFPYEGEQIVDVPVRIAEDNEIILDNEDSGFSIVQTEESSLLKKLLLQEEEENAKYTGLNSWRPPRSWKATTNSDFYGKFTRSAYYIRSGEGDKKAVWKIPIKENGYYAVYTYITKISNHGPGRGRGNNDTKGEYEYTIHHDDGDEVTALNLKSADDGWNKLGSFYFSPDSAVVELSNKSESQIVIADAIKLIKQ